MPYHIQTRRGATCVRTPSVRVWFLHMLTCKCVRSMARLAARVSLRQACMPRPAQARRSCRLRSTLAAAPVFFAQAFLRCHTENSYPRWWYTYLVAADVTALHVAYIHALKGLALPRASHSSEIVLAVPHRLRSTLAAAPLQTVTVATAARSVES